MTAIMAITLRAFGVEVGFRDLIPWEIWCSSILASCKFLNINRSSGACGAAAVWQVRILRVCLVVLEGDWGGANL